MTDETVSAPVIMVARDLRVSYPVADGKVNVLDGFSIHIHEREVVGLIGDAGSGKSTAALALMGVIRPPGQLEAGSVKLGDEELLAADEDRLREIRGRDIGLIVQNPCAALNPMLKVGHQIGNVFRAHSDASKADADERAVEMLRMVGINDPEQRVSAFAHELSGGMAQRALISMALSCAPRLLIADEPTSGLDVTIQAQFLDQMWETVQRTGSAILLISQDLGVIANYCDRVAVLHGGRIVEEKPVYEFFAHPEHPYSRDVLGLQKAATAGRPHGDDLSAERPRIEVKGLRKVFSMRGTNVVVEAIKGADFVIRSRETLGLVGESGSGKTTVGRCLLRLEEPTAGEVYFGGEAITGCPAASLRGLRSKMQIVFQDPFDALNPRWTIRRILREPLDLHSGLSAKAKDVRIRELLDLVGLRTDWIDRKPRTLGAAALQRLNIARAIATEPRFIVLDEPTSALAPHAITGLITLLHRLQAQFGLSYLFISHDLTTARSLCHRVAVMYLGEIVEMGDADQIFEDPQHDYSKMLLGAYLYPDPTKRRERAKTRRTA